MKLIPVIYLLAVSNSVVAFSSPRPALRHQTRIALADNASDRPTSTSLPDLDTVIKSSKYGWEKNPPKQTLRHVGQDHTAPEWFLNLVEVVHYLSFPTQFLVVVAILQHYDVWATMFDNDVLRLGLWIAAPLAQACGGIAPIAMHVYEDWQVAPALGDNGDMVKPANTEQENFYSAEIIPSTQVANNERLRQSCYSLLFTGLGLGSVMTFHGFHGWNDPIGIMSLLTTASLFTWNCIGDKNQLVSKILNKPSLIPITVPGTLWMAYAYALTGAFVYLPLANQIDDVGLKASLTLSQFVVAAGGIIEGAIAEDTYDQKWHLIAVLVICAGGLMQAWGLSGIGAYLAQ